MADLSRQRAAHTKLAQALVPQYIERLGWDGEMLAAHRAQALRILVKLAVEGSAWHRSRLADAPVDRLEPADLVTLPAMTKHDVMAHFDEIVTDARLKLVDVESRLTDAADGCYLFDQYTPLATGGSTGRRTVMVYDREGLAAWWLSAFRGLLAWRSGDPEMMSRQITVCWVTASHSSHVSAAMAKTFNDPAFKNVSLPVTLPVDAIVAGLNQTQPDVLMGYPSALVPLTREAAAGRLRISPRRVIAGGEPLLPEIRDAVRATWPVHLTNWWGSTESGVHMLPCDLGFNHVAEDLVILEPVDVDGNPVPAGVRSAKVLVTNLFNRVLPLIRYELTDEVTMVPGICECGWASARVADVQGRLDDSFHYPGAAIHPHLFRSALGRRPQVVEYQIRQTERGADIVVSCSAPLNLGELTAEVERALAAAGLASPEVAVTTTDARLGRLPETGKLKRFVPLPGLVVGSR